MCGICFFINYHPTKKIDLKMVKDTFIGLESRGTDASGYYFEREEKDGKVLRMINKCGITATELWEQTQDRKSFEKEETKRRFNKYKLNGKEKFIMIHTRHKTQGSETFNNNNHPIFSEKYVLIHNGVITSDRLPDYPYMGTVDSEEILAYMETYGMKKGIELSEGSMSIVFKETTANHIYLYRNSNPMDILYFPQKQLLVGISDDSYVDIPAKFSMLQTRIFKPEYISESLQLDSLYKLSLLEKKFTFLGEIKTTKKTYGTSTATQKGKHQIYNHKTGKWDWGSLEGDMYE